MYIERINIYIFELLLKDYENGYFDRDDFRKAAIDWAREVISREQR